MSKLIYSQTSALIEGTYQGIKNRDQAVNPVYYSIAFTGDGFLYTHGRKFRLFNVVNDEVEGVIFQIQRGVAGLYIDGTSLGTGNVIQSITNDGIITSSITEGVATIGHAEFLTENQASTYGSSTQIPIITVNKSGHITAISNSTTIDISKIRADATTTTGQYHPVGVTNNTLQNPLYQNNFYFDGQGNVHANNYYIGNNALSELFAPLSHTSVYATDTTYGHVKLSDIVDDTKGVNEHIAATPKALSAAIATANQYSEDLIAAQDAMVFVGTVEANGVITAHNDVVSPGIVDGTSTLANLDYKVGWTLRFTSAGTYQGQEVEIGDMIIAIKKRGDNFSINDWTIIQTNISGALTATSNLNGLLYSGGSRVVSALALSNGVLKSDGSTLSFVNPNTLWRDIKINNTSIGTNPFNLIAGTNISLTVNNGDITVSAGASDILAASYYLTIAQNSVEFKYKPNAASTLQIGGGLSLTTNNSAYTLSHATGTTITSKLGRITTDQYGHITSVEEVSTLPNPNALVFKDNAGNSILSYSGSTTTNFVFANGTDVGFTFSTNNNEQVITPTITHKYRGVQFYPTSSSESPVSLLANTVNTVLTLVGGNNVTLSTSQNLSEGTLIINAEDTWRNIETYKFQSNLFSRSSIGDTTLKFSDDFLFGGDEIGIVWTEIDDDGRVTYVK